MIGFKLKKPGYQPIGLDIGHNSIKMIQLAVNGNQMSVLAADKAHFDGDINGDEEKRRSFLISTIKRMLTERDFHKRNVISCLPSDKLKITSLRLAETDSEKIEQALRKEAASRFGLDPDKDVIKHLVAGNVRQGDEIKTELILFAADNESIKSHIELLEAADLEPVGIDTAPCALFRTFERLLRRQEDKDCRQVFVDVGTQFTTVVFGHGREISFVKQIPIGGEKFNHQIATKLGISISEAQALRAKLRCNSQCEQDGLSLDASTRQMVVDALSGVAEELARQISLCFRYYTVAFRGKRIERAIFAGGEAYENILLNVLKRQLTVEIEVAEPLRGFDMSSERKNVNFDSDRRGLLCEWAVAVGLSLKGLNKTAADGDNYEGN